VRVVLSGQARTDLREIAFYIARDNRKRALSFVRELQQKAKEIGEMPRAFPVVPRYERQGIRRRVYRNYLIFFRIERRRVLVIHVLHGARDYESILFPDD
jgi:plasmid stabilization system protein ParE